MIEGRTRYEITEIWRAYLASGEVEKMNGGLYRDKNDSTRLEAIRDILSFIRELEENKVTIHEFKSKIDSYNKRNNLWGFTATKGQMFFNQLLRESAGRLDAFTKDFLWYIKEPLHLGEALEKIKDLEMYSAEIYERQKDKRRGPNPLSVGYFLSFFWHIRNRDRWPILFSSLIQTWEYLKIWKPVQSQSEAYEQLNRIIVEVRAIFESETKTNISNWLIEHAFWHYFENEINSKPKGKGKSAIDKKTKPQAIKIVDDVGKQLEVTPKFDLSEYLGTRASRLLALGFESDKSSSQKGYEFEQGVSEVFKMMGFETTPYGQGKGRLPDAILKYPRERVAFMVDAKAYSKGYSIGTDYRAIDDYISNIGQQLIKDGYDKLGFIIVSNQFSDTNIEYFSNKATWNTAIRRFIFLETEALLYLLAVKIKDGLSTSDIIDILVNSGYLITSKKIFKHHV